MFNIVSVVLLYSSHSRGLRCIKAFVWVSSLVYVGLVSFLFLTCHRGYDVVVRYSPICP